MKIYTTEGNLDRIGFKKYDFKVGHHSYIHQLLEGDLKAKSFISSTFKDGYLSFKVVYHVRLGEDIGSYVRDTDVFTGRPLMDIFTGEVFKGQREVFLSVENRMFPDLGMTENMLETAYRDFIMKFSVRGKSNSVPVGVMRTERGLLVFIAIFVEGSVVSLLEGFEWLKSPYQGLKKRSVSLLEELLSGG